MIIYKTRRSLINFQFQVKFNYLLRFSIIRRSCENRTFLHENSKASFDAENEKDNHCIGVKLLKVPNPTKAKQVGSHSLYTLDTNEGDLFQLSEASSGLQETGLSSYRNLG